MFKEIDYTLLREGLRNAQASGISYCALRDKTEKLGYKVSNTTIGRIADENNKKPALKIWNVLHRAAPQYIPPPPIFNQAPVNPNQQISNADILPDAPMRRIPVFDAGAGKDCNWSDNGYPVGLADTYEYATKQETDENTFAVRVHGDSMLPEIKHNNTVIVVPSQQLEHGCICFVTEQGDEGIKVVRRYFDYPDMIILRPDNPTEGFEIIINKNNGSKYRIYRVTEIRKKA